MEFLTDTDEIDIDVFGIIMSIDDIMHKEITDKTGITVSHRDIQKFIGGIVGENNREQRRRRRRNKELKDKIKNDKVIYELNNIKDIIRFYILGYIIIHPNGCTYNQEFMKCCDCRYIFNDEECRYFRKDNNALLSCEHKKFI